MAHLATLPRTDAEIADAASLIDLTIPLACLPGIAVNLDLLARHAAILRDEVQS